ncbi:BURP domain-containing protein BNM2A-like [Salvia miltiorrhiza]|uniref:BURP domain-containing protein BNM2A-like n=1 Tax=Salvia miltiorrhiza TaxID=226208 RepID=UPI0025AD2B8F|nr:BURP domain-containing protein BNM2A-like [Salvia miltiorrhiza]
MKMSPPILLVYSVFLLQCLEATEGQLHLRSRSEDSGMKRHDEIEAELKVFFHYKDLKAGNKMAIYFPRKQASHLLSRDESDAIPFSSSRLPSILQLLSFSEGSKQANAMRDTLHHCEFPPIKGEAKFCATSLESMLDSLHQILGSSSKLRVLTTTYLSNPIRLLQNYTVSEAPMEISAPKIVGCHTLPYPYAVFYCHGQESDNKLYKVMLEGDDGGRVDAAAMCHMDTSQWDPTHNAFRALRSLPGASPVCHFFPADNLVWIPLT